MVLLAGMALRFAIAYLLFPGQGFEGDLSLHERWMLTIADTGPRAFYQHVDQALPPGFLWILWPFGVLARLLMSQGILQANAAWVIVKLPAMLADGLVALLLWRAVGRWASPRAGVVAAALFLFLPVTWYESALWGQIDAIGSLVVLATLVLLDAGWSEGAAVAGVAAALVKPQFGIVLFVVAIVLLRRHLLAPGSGHTVRLPGWPPRLGAGRLPSWLADPSGPIRLATSGAAAIVAGLALVLPFDLSTRASADIAQVPLLGPLAGLVRIVGDQASVGPVLVANAFTPWALVGPNPLPVAGIAHWQYDSLLVLDGISAFQLGSILTALAFAVGAAFLLWREDRARILAVLVFVVVALFLFATRVHERYVYPAFVLGAPFAAVSLRWRAWYVLLGLANLVNLHAVLVHGGTGGAEHLPIGIWAQSAPVITAISVAQGALCVVAIALVFAGVGAARLMSGRTLGGAA